MNGKLFTIKNIGFAIIAILAICYFFVFVLGIPYFFLISLGISIIIVYFLSKKRNAVTLFITVLLVVFNIGILLFFLIPTYSKQISLNDFYKNKKNYLKIQINDEEQILKNNNCKLKITNKSVLDTRPIIHDLQNPKKNGVEIEIYSGDVITFESKTKNLKTLINVYLWDGTILRVFPQSSISINKIFQNNSNLIDSKTLVQLNQGTVWFRIIKTIITDDGFNVKTDNGTLVIRGTSGVISKNGENFGATNTLVYSNDHIVEFQNQKEKTLINQGERMQFNNETNKTVEYNQFERMLGKDFIKQIDKINEYDLQDIQNYYNDIKQYVIDKFGWSLQGKSNLEAICSAKLKFMANIDDKYKINLENYKKYKLLLDEEKLNDESEDEKNMFMSVYIWLFGKKTKDDDIQSLTDDMIFVPLNSQIQELKVDYIKSKLGDGELYIKAYIFTILNNVLDNENLKQGKNQAVKNLELLKENFEKIKQLYNTNLSELSALLDMFK